MVIANRRSQTADLVPGRDLERRQGAAAGLAPDAEDAGRSPIEAAATEGRGPRGPCAIGGRADAFGERLDLGEARIRRLAAEGPDEPCQDADGDLFGKLVERVQRHRAELSVVPVDVRLDRFGRLPHDRASRAGETRRTARDGVRW